MLAICRPLSSYTCAAWPLCITLPMAIALSSIGHRIGQTSSNTSYRTMLSDYVYLALAGSAWNVMVPHDIEERSAWVTCGECRMVTSFCAKICPYSRTESTSGWSVFDWDGSDVHLARDRLRRLLFPGGCW